MGVSIEFIDSSYTMNESQGLLTSFFKQIWAQIFLLK